MDHLFAKARDGDKGAEKELFQYLFKRFAKIAKRRVGEGEAEDIAQDACITVLQKYKSETFTKGFGPWAYGVLRMKIGNYMQGLMVREKKLIPIMEDKQEAVAIPSPESAYELKRKLIDCSKKIIRNNQRQGQVLNYFALGYKTGEVCRKLRITPNSFYIILHRVRQILRTCMETGKV
jgi:RNA polymerase sigma factor (sigma-70 family)